MADDGGHIAPHSPVSSPLPGALIGAGVGAAAGVAFLTRAVTARDTRSLDALARGHFPECRWRATRVAAEGIGFLGKWWGQAPASAAAATPAWRARGPAATAPIAAASTTAAALAWLFERALRAGRRDRPRRVE